MKNFFYSQFVENKRNLQFFKNFSKNFFRKSFVVQKLAVPLHSLSTSNAHYGKRDESETILENIPYRHSSTAVFFLLSARQEDCSNKKYTGTKIRTVKNSICQPLYTIESGQHQTDNTLLK